MLIFRFILFLSCVESNGNDFKYTAITFNYRGVLCDKSEQELLALGLSKGQLRTLFIKVLQGTLKIWNVRRRSTQVHRKVDLGNAGMIQRGAGDATHVLA